MHKAVFLFFLLVHFFELSASPEAAARRMNAYLLVEDPKSAAQEAEKALRDYPQEPLIYEWAIRCHAAYGEEGLMMDVWESFHTHYSQAALQQDLLEDMAWGIIKKGKEALGLSSQLIGVLGAALTQDIRAVPFLLEGMRHSNAHLRAISVELGALYGDYPLRKEIIRLFREEKVLEVRMKVIGAIGKLQLEEFLPELIQCVANPKTGAKEKLAAIKAIVEMKDCINPEELLALATNKRAGLRELACAVIAACDLKEEEQVLIPLIRDPHPDVCAAALTTWGLLRREVTDEIRRLAIGAYDPLVGITATWVWMIDQPEEAEPVMLKWLQHDKPHARALAAAAVCSAGSYGISCAKKMLQCSTDPYVLANLALALAGQREECAYVCQLLEDFLHSNQDKWMLSENGIFRTLEKSNLSHDLMVPNYPEVINQTVRLELLNLLAILESPHALEAIKSFLKERKWGVTGLAAELLLDEGDEAAIDLVRELLQDPDQEIRLESALILASWGRDPAAISTLMEVYPKADRQLQLKILESLGRIGDKQVIPFLIDRFREPSLMIRIVAASVLIQTLNLG